MRKRKRKAASLIALAAALAAVAIHAADAGAPSPAQPLDGPFVVARVVDGDTFVAVIAGEDAKVRLIGVDTPESAHPDKSRNSEEGREAAAWAKATLEGATVFLEYDVAKTDRYGRLLAYVWLDDGKTMFQEELLSRGMATVMTVPPNVAHSDYFLMLQKKARETGAGFWKRGFLANK